MFGSVWVLHEVFGVIRSLGSGSGRISTEDLIFGCLGLVF